MPDSTHFWSPECQKGLPGIPRTPRGDPFGVPGDPPGGPRDVADLVVRVFEAQIAALGGGNAAQGGRPLRTRAPEPLEGR